MNTMTLFTETDMQLYNFIIIVLSMSALCCFSGYLLYIVNKQSKFIMSKDSYQLVNTVKPKVDKKKAEENQKISDYFKVMAAGVCDDEDIKKFHEDGVIS